MRSRVQRQRRLWERGLGLLVILTLAALLIHTDRAPNPLDLIATKERPPRVSVSAARDRSALPLTFRFSLSR